LRNNLPLEWKNAAGEKILSGAFRFLHTLNSAEKRSIRFWLEISPRVLHFVIHDENGADRQAEALTPWPPLSRKKTRERGGKK